MRLTTNAGHKHMSALGAETWLVGIEMCLLCGHCLRGEMVCRSNLLHKTLLGNLCVRYKLRDGNLLHNKRNRGSALVLLSSNYGSTASTESAPAQNARRITTSRVALVGCTKNACLIVLIGNVPSTSTNVADPSCLNELYLEKHCFDVPLLRLILSLNLMNISNWIIQ